MSATFFDDVFDKEDKAMTLGSYDIDKPFELPGIKLQTLKLKSSPAKDCKMTNVTNMVRGKGDGQYDFKHKTEVEMKLCSCVDSKLTVDAKDVKLEGTYTPKELNENGQETSFSDEFSYNPQKGSWKGALEAKLGGIEVGPMKSWNHLKYDIESGKELSHSLTQSTNLNMDKDYNLGWSLSGDLVAKKLTSAHAHLAAKHNDNLHWLRFSKGCMVACGMTGSPFGCGPKLTNELQYHLCGAKGIKDLPLFWRGGASWALAHGQKWQTTWLLGSTWMVQNKHTIPIDDKLTLTYHDECNWQKMLTGSKDIGWKAGFTVEFKL